MIVFKDLMIDSAAIIFLFHILKLQNYFEFESCSLTLHNNLLFCNRDINDNDM